MVAFSSLRQLTSKVAADYGCTVDGMAGDDVEEETDGSHVALLRLQPKSKAGYSYSGRIISPLHSRLILEIRTLNALVGDVIIDQIPFMCFSSIIFKQHLPCTFRL